MSEYLNTCLQFFRALDVDWARKDISVPYFVEGLEGIPDIVTSTSLVPESASYMPDVNTVFIEKARKLIREGQSVSNDIFSVTASRQDKMLTMREVTTGCFLTLQAGDSIDHGIKVSLGYGDYRTTDFCQLSFGVYPDEVRWSQLVLSCPLDDLRAQFTSIASNESALPAILRSVFTLLGYGHLFDEIHVMPHDPEKAWYGTEADDLSVSIKSLKDDEGKVYERLAVITLAAKAYQSFRSIPSKWELFWSFMKSRFSSNRIGI